MADLSDTRLLIEAIALVVDDVDAGRSQIQDKLRRVGVGRVEHCSDSATAFTDLQALQPDLMVAETDVSPLDGFDLANLVRTSAGPKLESLPILLILQRSTQQEVERARAAGVDDLLIAPVDEAVLRSRVLRLLRKRAEQAESETPSLASATNG